jgi:hypothetical protein
MTLPKSVLETHNELLFLRHDEELEVTQVVPERTPF